jgi:hypothetical protein
MAIHVPNSMGKVNQVLEVPGFLNITASLRSGCYLLAHRGVVIYIGQAKTLLGRVYTHRNLWGQKARGKRGPDWMPIKGILFDEVHICPCPTDKLDEFERELIALYKPKFNINLKAPGQANAPASLRIAGRIVVMTSVRPQPQIERRI